MRLITIKLLFLFSFLLSYHVHFAQYYFKQLSNADQYFNQKIARFLNGDILIVDSFSEAQRTNGNGKVFLSKVDICGNVQWSKSYERTEYLEVKDLEINNLGEAFIYGSAYEGLEEMIFLLKVNSDGGVEQFRLFKTETVDHFSYTLDVKGDLIMIYGLILDFDTQKQGFVIALDDGLNFNWGKKFAPFDSNGAAVITADDGFMCRSGSYIMRLNAEGKWKWGRSFTSESGTNLIAGPFKHGDGYIFEAILSGSAFFFKIDDDGNLIWQTKEFESGTEAAEISLRSNGQFLATYNCENEGKTTLCYQLFDPSGQRLTQHFLATDKDIQPGLISQSIYQDTLVNIAANADLFAGGGLDVVDFLLQFSLNRSDKTCIPWNALEYSPSNSTSIVLTPFDTVTVNTMLTPVGDNNVKINSIQEPLFLEICGVIANQKLVQIDTLINCEDSWEITLPNVEFQWEDGSKDNPRSISQIGTYRAKNIGNCANATIYEYTLRKDACDCQIYLPTAFSPNEDGINESLQLYTTCTPTVFQMNVYDRWGGKIFETRNKEDYWRGNNGQKSVAAGLYLVTIYYEWEDGTGNIQSNFLTQEVTLIR